MAKIPFGDDSVKEENMPREPWIQEGITVFNKMGIRDRVKAHISDVLLGRRFVCTASLGFEVAEEILSIPELAIVDRGAMKIWDESIDTMPRGLYERGYYQGQQDMLNQGWQKVLDK